MIAAQAVHAGRTEQARPAAVVEPVAPRLTARVLSAMPWSSTASRGTGSRSWRLRRSARRANSLRLEGVVCKRSESTHQPGRTSRAWVKTLNPPAQPGLLCGYIPGRNTSVGALIVAGHTDGGVVRYCGTVPFGLSPPISAALHWTMQRGAGSSTTPTNPALVWWGGGPGVSGHAEGRGMRIQSDTAWAVGYLGS